ncbi:MAG: hypothetical protein M1838_005762 [Thelocarpon superellum]|nr:MAG: hypothetical protein M1838_005762 [Thelocarpon superellum]
MKHATLVSRIEKSSTAKKRRRPAANLVAHLQSLADALPDVETKDKPATVVGQARIKRMSLKSRPGATKRKEQLHRMEIERFGKNMAQMAEGGAPPQPRSNQDVPPHPAASATNARWTALRSFIAHTRGSVNKRARPS